MDAHEAHAEAIHSNNRLLKGTYEDGYKAGREAGMREAAEICKKKSDWILGRQSGPSEELSNVIVRHHASAHFAAHEAILAAIEGEK